jgi:hypothetical protein
MGTAFTTFVDVNLAAARTGDGAIAPTVELSGISGVATLPRAPFAAAAVRVFTAVAELDIALDVGTCKAGAGVGTISAAAAVGLVAADVFKPPVPPAAADPDDAVEDFDVATVDFLSTAAACSVDFRFAPLCCVEISAGAPGVSAPAPLPEAPENDAAVVPIEAERVANWTRISPPSCQVCLSIAKNTPTAKICALYET